MKKILALAAAVATTAAHAATDSTYAAFITASQEGAAGGKTVVSGAGIAILGVVVLASVIGMGIAMWKRRG